MPRLKKKKESAEPQKQSNFHLWMIIFLLILQTAFLFYKNMDTIKDIFKTDPNEYYKDELGSSQSELDQSGNAHENVSMKNIRINIFNGCGSAGIATIWKDKLRKMNLDVRETGNTEKKYSKSLILSRIEDMRYAKQLAKKLGVSNDNVVMQLNKDLVDIDLTLIIGSDHKELEKRKSDD